MLDWVSSYDTKLRWIEKNGDNYVFINKNVCFRITLSNVYPCS